MSFGCQAKAGSVEMDMQLTKKMASAIECPPNGVWRCNREEMI